MVGGSLGNAPALGTRGYPQIDGLWDIPWRYPTAALCGLAGHGTRVDIATAGNRDGRIAGDGSYALLGGVAVGRTDGGIYRLCGHRLARCLGKAALRLRLRHRRTELAAAFLLQPVFPAAERGRYTFRTQTASPLRQGHRGLGLAGQKAG